MAWEDVPADVWNDDWSRPVGMDAPTDAPRRGWMERLRGWWWVWREGRYGVYWDCCGCDGEPSCGDCLGEGLILAPPGVLEMLRVDVGRLRRWVYWRDRTCDCGAVRLFGRLIRRHNDDCVECLPF